MDRTDAATLIFHIIIFVPCVSQILVDFRTSDASYYGASQSRKNIQLIFYMYHLCRRRHPGAIRMLTAASRKRNSPDYYKNNIPLSRNVKVSVVRRQAGGLEGVRDS